MYRHFKKSLLFVGVIISIPLVQPTIAMNENQIIDKLNTVRTKIKNYDPVSEYPWESAPTPQTDGILKATIQGNEYPICHTNFFAATKLESEVKQKKCNFNKIQVNYVPYPNFNINAENNPNEDEWFY